MNEIFTILKRINEEEKVSILVVEQNARAALSLAHYGYVMENGKIVLQDTANNLAENADSVSKSVQKMRWQIRMKTGFDPESVKISDRFKQVVTWKGPMDTDYLDSLQKAYAEKIRDMAKSEE